MQRGSTRRLKLLIKPPKPPKPSAPAPTRGSSPTVREGVSEPGAVSNLGFASRVIGRVNRVVTCRRHVMFIETARPSHVFRQERNAEHFALGGDDKRNRVSIDISPLCGEDAVHIVPER